MRKDFACLKQKQEEGTFMQKLNQPLENCQKEATMELLKVKDRAIDLERNVRCQLCVFISILGYKQFTYFNSLLGYI